METNPSQRGWLSALMMLLVGASVATSASPVDPTCRTFECLTLAAEMTTMMNQSADPCNDFHNYACGNFPNVIRYNHANAHAGGGFGEVLFEDSLSVMGEKLERNIFEMLVTDRTVKGDDPDMRQLYNFTRLFFRSCGEWMQQNQVGNDSYNNASSVEFFKDVYDHLMLSIDPKRRPDNSFESVLATLTKSGGNSMMKIELRDDVAETLVTEEPDVTEEPRAQIGMNDKYYKCKPNYDPFIRFFLDQGIGKNVMLEKQTKSFGEIETRFTCFPGTEYATVGDYMFETRQCEEPSGDVFSISELDEMSRCIQPDNPFSWSLYFDKLLHTNINNETKLKVSSVKKVIAFVNYFKELPLYTRTAVNGAMFNKRVSFLIFDWLLSFADFFPRQLRETWSDVGKKTSQIQRIKGDITGGCMRWTKQHMQPIVERMYQRSYHSESFDDVRNILHLLKNASIISVNRQSWISESAKRAIAAKIRSMQHSIGFKELTTDQLKVFYNSTIRAFNNTKLTGDLKDSFGSIFALALCADVRKNFEVISGKSPVSIFLALNPMQVNAFNFMEKNQIIFPMAILAPRVYHASYPDYIKLGSLGYVIGHEVGHAFDDTGHEINRTGATGHFWDNATESNFLSRMNCVIKSFAKFRLYPGGPKHDSKSSVGNDIADIMGIKAAYGAMQLVKRRSWGGRWTKLPNMPPKYSPEQLFFIQAAQDWCIKAEPSTLEEIFGYGPSHSPHAVRVNGMLQNTKEFADAFKCRAGKAMHPRKKCSFW